MSQLIIPPWERWLPVVGYEGYYEVSDYGRVRSVDRWVRFSDGRLRHYTGQLLSVYHRPPDERPTVGLCRGDRATGQPRLVYRLVLRAFVGACPPGMECCHNNDNVYNNVLGNLRYDTKSANMYDKVRNGRHHAVNKLICPRQHALVIPNLVASRWKKGHRICLSCQRAFVARCNAEKRGEHFDFRLMADQNYAKIMGA